jgi:hypothetical protein
MTTHSLLLGDIIFLGVGAVIGSLATLTIVYRSEVKAFLGRVKNIFHGGA